MENKLEQGPEKIPTKEEVLEIIGLFAEKAEIIREVSDDKGLFILELGVGDKEKGEFIEFEYMRKGRVEGKGGSIQSSIEVVYYQDGILKSYKEALRKIGF